MISRASGTTNNLLYYRRCNNIIAMRVGSSDCTDWTEDAPPRRADWIGRPGTGGRPQPSPPPPAAGTEKITIVKRRPADQPTSE